MFPGSQETSTLQLETSAVQINCLHRIATVADFPTIRQFADHIDEKKNFVEHPWHEKFSYRFFWCWDVLPPSERSLSSIAIHPWRQNHIACLLAAGSSSQRMLWRTSRTCGFGFLLSCFLALRFPRPFRSLDSSQSTGTSAWAGLSQTRSVERSSNERV